MCKTVVFLAALCSILIVRPPIVDAAGSISIAGPATNPVVGNSFTVNVQVTGITDLYAFQFDLSFDPAILSAVSITEGPFLPGGGTTFFIPGTIDNIGGHITFTADTLVGAIPGVTGSGTLATATFSVNTVGTSAVSPGNVILLDSSLGGITATIQNGSISTVAPTVSIPTLSEWSLAVFVGLLISLALLSLRRAPPSTG